MRPSRRSFLKCLGLGAGASLVGPLIHRVVAQTGTPRRFVFVVETNGIYPYAFMSDGARAAIDGASSNTLGASSNFHKDYGHQSPIEIAGDALHTAPALNPLAETGMSLTERSAVILGLSSKVTGGGHTTANGALSCARGAPRSPAGPTIDAVLAERVGADTPFEALRIGIGGNRASRLVYSMCAYGSRRPAPLLTDPASTFYTLFGSVADAAGQRRFQERRELLDFSRRDVTRALASFSGPSNERLKLEKYLESIETLAARQDRLVEMESTLASVKPENPPDNPLYATNDPLDRLAAQFELATSALLGELTNVVVIGSGAGDFNVEYPSLDPNNVGRHTLHHEFEQQAHKDIIMAATRRHVELIAGMAGALAETPEIGADGSMLDHTVIVYMSDNGETHHSSAEEWPMLLVGGNALGCRTDGRTVVYPGHGQAGNRQVSNLFNSLGHAAGDPEMNEFGFEGASRIAPGPLSEIYEA